MFYIVLLTITLIVTSDLHTLRNGPNGVTPAFPEHEEDGPFCMLYTNFFREIIKKSDLALKDIFGATDLAIQKMNREGHFVWLGDSQNMVQELLINEFEEISAEELKAQAKILSDRMRNRTQYYDAEINYVFDYLNNFFTKNDTARGSEALSKFRAYPQANKTPYMLCYDLIEAFNQPFYSGNRDHTFASMFSFTRRILKKAFPDAFEKDYNDTGSFSSDETERVNLKISMFLT